MHKATRFLIKAVLLAALSPTPGRAQIAPVITIDFENWVSYVEDTFDVARRAVNPGVTPPAASRNFNSSASIADIVAVNGEPARGSIASTARTLRLLPIPANGAAISDAPRGSILDYAFEILKSDGTPIGSIMASGFGGGGRTPGAPLAVTNGNFAIVGGTGAFLGVRGQAGLVFTPGAGDVRNASMAEDPGNRRVNGGGKQRYVLHLVPLFQPETVVTPSGPAIFHADFSRVTADKPGRPGEVLIVMATGLGPTRPGVDPGAPFPVDPVQIVNSPVRVTLNGNTAEVINQVGWPTLVDTYRVDFRVPEGTASGPAAMRLSAAWIPGPDVKIPIGSGQ